MGYSLKQSDFYPSKQGAEFTYFSEEDWNSYPFAGRENTAWFREAKFGLFLHVGISAMGMVDISWPRVTHKLPDPPYWGKTVSDETYDSWAKTISFPKFNAMEWAGIAKQSGFPLLHVTLPFQHNSLQSFSCLTGEQARLRVKHNKLHVTVAGKKHSTPDTIIQIKLGNPPVKEH